MSDFNISVTPDDATSRFPSLSSLRVAHSELLKRHREIGSTPELLTEIEKFICQGRATGVLLDTDEDRWASQSLLDYWTAILYRSGHKSFDATLAEFDPALVPELNDRLCPYPGLEPFREEKSNLFYGRQRLLEKLVNHLKKNRLLTVVGSSGSGKSSVVLGGLLPSLKAGMLSGSDNWHYYSPMVPGSNPLQNLSRLIKPENANTTKGLQYLVENFLENPNYLVQALGEFNKLPTVFFIDQFEEIFTLCRDNALRQAFIANILRLIHVSDGKYTVIITMRTDFESYFEKISNFKPVLESSKVIVTALDANELRETIKKPAERIGLKFEEGIVNSLIQDIIGEPTPLPLLQFTLKKLWNKRKHNYVTWESYQQIGGGRRSLIHSADIFYESLTLEEQIIAKRILLNLVGLGKGLEITSNRIRRTDCLNSVRKQLLALDSTQELEETPQISQLEEVDTVQEQLLALDSAQELLVPAWGWIIQQSKLNLPITLPEIIFRQLLHKCQELLTSSLPLGAKLVQAVEELFPNDSQTLNDIAGMMLRSPSRSVNDLETMFNIQSDYSDLREHQQIALSLLAVKQLLENLTLPLSLTKPVDQVLNKLIQAGLVKLTEGDTPDDAQIELVHDALLYNWPCLVAWLEDEKLGRHKRLQLRADAERWEARGRDSNTLLRGTLLEEVLSYEDLNDLETEFVKLSKDAFKKTEQEKKAAQEREQELTQVLAENNRRYNEKYAFFKKRLNFQASTTITFSFFAIMMATIAFLQHNQAEDQKQIAKAFQEKAETAQKSLEEQKRINESCHQVAIVTKDLSIIFDKSSPPELKYERIRYLQIRLRELEFLTNNKEVDGYWGPKTQTAFVKFIKNINPVCKKIEPSKKNDPSKN